LPYPVYGLHCPIHVIKAVSAVNDLMENFLGRTVGRIYFFITFAAFQQCGRSRIQSKTNDTSFIWQQLPVFQQPVVKKRALHNIILYFDDEGSRASLSGEWLKASGRLDLFTLKAISLPATKGYPAGKLLIIIIVFGKKTIPLHTQIIK
jgi:hypothetical protein